MWKKRAKSGRKVLILLFLISLTVAIVSLFAS